MRKSKLQTEDEVEEKAIEILAKVRQRLEKIGEGSFQKKKGGSKVQDEEQSNSVGCVCCLLPIEKGDFFVSMPCCGSMCHILCMAKVSNSHPLLMSHACPHCMKQLNEEQEGTFIKMWQILKTFSKGNDD